MPQLFGYLNNFDPVRFMNAIFGPLDIVWALILVLDVALFFGIIIAFMGAWKYRPKLEITTDTRQAREMTLRRAVYGERWNAITKKAGSGSADSLRMSVIEADSLVNDILREAGFPGEHLADRLSALDPGELKTLDSLWKAHRVRNDLVHTPGFYLSPENAKVLLASYESFLKEVRAI